jgi:hypothetical protein
MATYGNWLAGWVMALNSQGVQDQI